MVTIPNSNKQPFEYKLTCTHNPLKESQDSSNFSKYEYLFLILIEADMKVPNSLLMNLLQILRI